MPTNRTRRSRTAKTPLTEPEKRLLLTGDCCPAKGSWGDYGELKFRTFGLVSPAGWDELRTLWTGNRDVLMAEWKGKGLPWAAKKFEDKRLRMARGATQERKD